MFIPYSLAKVPALASLLIACVGTSVSNGSIIFQADVDTYVQGVLAPDTNFSTDPNDRLLVFSNGGAPRAQYAYVRFDLSELGSYEAGSILSFTVRDGSMAFTPTQALVYGLPSQPGNTVQDWGVETLTYNQTGSEFAKPVVVGENPLDLSRVSFLGFLTNESNTNANAGDNVSISGSALDDFLADRFADGGLATFIIANAFNTQRTIQLISSSGTNGPRLEVIPEPQTFAIVVGLCLIPILLLRRKRV